MKCSIVDCENKARQTGLCGMHYKRKWRHGDPLKTLVNRGFERIKCVADEDCNNISTYGCGLCEKHHRMQHRHDRTQRVINEKGQGTISNGYVVFTVDGKRKFEHTILAEKALGRPLPLGAMVHHTGKRNDNHGYFKLVICPNHEYHMLIHRRMKELGYENNQD